MQEQGSALWVVWVCSVSNCQWEAAVVQPHLKGCLQCSCLQGHCRGQSFACCDVCKQVGMGVGGMRAVSHSCGPISNEYLLWWLS